MKIILISIGTPGDMAPFLAIGEILKEEGPAEPDGTVLYSRFANQNRSLQSEVKHFVVPL